jgi:N-acetylmuramoyl-L-alanine amidase
MARRTIALVVLILGAAGLAQPRPGLLQVTAVRLWSLSEATRVVIEVSGDFQFHAERLHNPDRVFFDVFRSEPSIGGKRAYSRAVRDRLVNRIRVAETLPGVSRVVLDLEGPVEFSASQLANPARLVIELRRGAVPAEPAPPVSAGAPAAGPAGTDTPPVAGIVKTEPAPAAPPPEMPAAASRNSSGKNSLTRALGLKVGRVVLDPGHGGHDQGTVGSRGLMEKDLVLDVATRLGKLIEERMGSEVIFTRTGDTFVALEDRTALANEKKADLFLSLHANSSRSARIGGVETFYLNFTSSREALDVAARENAGSQKSIHELQDLIQKITLQEKIDESREFAGRMQAALFKFAARSTPGIKNRGIKTAPFVVLIGAQMPSVLAEIGFLSNAREEALLSRPDHRQRLAEALFSGLSRYAESLSHFQMAKAEE